MHTRPTVIDDLIEVMCNLTSPCSQSDDTCNGVVTGIDKNESSIIPYLSSVFHASIRHFVELKQRVPTGSNRIPSMTHFLNHLSAFLIYLNF